MACVFFFFKQKTAYEMLLCDWSSDVCSSDLLRVIGRPGGVPLPIRRGIDRVVEATRDNNGLTLVMAFNYGGRDELLEAVRALAVRVQAGELAPAAISEADVRAALYPRDI